MSFRTYLICMSFLTAASWIAWIIVIYTIDPTRSGNPGFVLFYLTLSVALTGTLSVLGLLIRIWLKNDEVMARISVQSFRQGILLSILFLVGLILSANNLIRWWNILLLIVIISLIELLFLSDKNRSL